MSEQLKDDRKGAIISDDGNYRYRLWRLWDIEKPAVAFIMLNPSEADETEDDPTVRRCVGYAKEWGYGELIIGNLFGYRTPDPDELKEQDDPIGPQNDAHLRDIVMDADLIVGGWGSNADDYPGRVQEVVDMLGDIRALKVTKGGQPWHPLYLPKEAEPEHFTYTNINRDQ